MLSLTLSFELCLLAGDGLSFRVAVCSTPPPLEECGGRRPVKSLLVLVSPAWSLHVVSLGNARGGIVNGGNGAGVVVADVAEGDVLHIRARVCPHQMLRNGRVYALQRWKILPDDHGLKEEGGAGGGVRLRM